jgi:hypothetical protein
VPAGSCSTAQAASRSAIELLHLTFRYGVYQVGFAVAELRRSCEIVWNTQLGKCIEA